MKFINPEVFLLIPAFWIAVLLLATAAGRKRKELLTRLLGSGAEDPAAVHLSYARRRWRIVFLLFAMTFLTLAAARPYWSTRLLPWEPRGRDVMVLFDVSKSMRAGDIPPSRLEHAKFLLRQIVQDSPGDRFGLAAFAGTAFLCCPLTSDTLAFDQYVTELSPDSVPVGGTNLELALTTAERAFKAASGNNRAILLLTDGEELTGQAARVLNSFRERGIPLLVAGIGDPSAAAPIPEKDGSMKRDRSGNLVTTRLNEPMLKKLAQSSGGIYVRSSVTDTGAKELLARLAQLEKSSRAGGKRTVPEEKFPLALAAAAVFFLLYLLLSERPGGAFKRAGAWLLCTVFLLGAAAPAEKKPTPPPAPEEQLPDVPEELYNLARTRQQKGDPSAEALYEKVLKSAAGKNGLQSRSLLNLGVGLHGRARREMQQAEKQIQGQQLDPALQQLNAAEKTLQGAEELYVRSLSLPEAETTVAAGDLRRLEEDRKKISEWKKKIEELKKQQQKAQQQAKQAQQQNKQQQKDQQKQDQKRKDQGQQQNNQQQNKKQDQQKQGQQQGQQTPEQAVRQAKQSARELARQAGDLRQQKLKEQAERAAKELEKAERAKQEKKEQEAQKHLDEAVRALGEPKQPDAKPQQKNAPGGEKKKDEKSGAPQPRPGAEAGKDDEKKSGEQLLKLLNDEENRRRGELRRDRNGRRPPVEKDW